MDSSSVTQKKGVLKAVPPRQSGPAAARPARRLFYRSSAARSGPPTPRDAAAQRPSSIPTRRRAVDLVVSGRMRVRDPSGISMLCARAACLAWLVAAPCYAEPPQAVVWYRSAEGCPDAAGFLERLGDRASLARVADAGDYVDFVVTLSASEQDTSGRLERQTERGTVAIRKIRDRECARVADALALSLALALDPAASLVHRATEPEAPTEATQGRSVGLPEHTVEAPSPSRPSGPPCSTEARSAAAWHRTGVAPRPRHFRPNCPAQR
jgi:hypothetical protein